MVAAVTPTRSARRTASGALSHPPPGSRPGCRVLGRRTGLTGPRRTRGLWWRAAMPARKPRPPPARRRPPTPATHSGRMAQSGGSHALPISGAQNRTASQPIILVRADGAATLPDVTIGSPSGVSQGLARYLPDFANKHGRVPGHRRPKFPSDLIGARSTLLVPVSVPYAGAVPDGGLIRLRRPMPSAPPSSSGLGHRPFKAAARVRIPLGARAGYGCTHEVL